MTQTQTIPYVQQRLVADRNFRFTECLNKMKPATEQEKIDISKALKYLSYGKSCFDRRNTQGHFTASAFVLNRDQDSVLLTLHAKLQKWLQLGGHVESIDNFPADTALREVKEESGLWSASLHPWHSTNPQPFDLDIHTIPARNGKRYMAEHLHYDCRYLLIDDGHFSVTPSSESLDLKWFTFEESEKIFESNPSLLRCVRKVRDIVA